MSAKSGATYTRRSGNVPFMQLKCSTAKLDFLNLVSRGITIADCGTEMVFSTVYSL